MKITMLRNAAKHVGCPLMEGETGEVENEIAERLVSTGIAILVTQEVKAIAKTPDIKGVTEKTDKK